MELKNVYGEVIFTLEGAKTVLELVIAAVASGKDLRGAYLSYAAADRCLAQAAVLGYAGLRGVPTIPSIHQAVYEAASRPGGLAMGEWHTCETTHCRAGWVVTLAGVGGQALEWALGTYSAAALIYIASDPKLDKVPDFWADNKTALADMKRLAEAA